MPLWCGIAEWGSGQLRDSGNDVSYNDDDDDDNGGMNVPTTRDFGVAIGFMLFGMLALVAGLTSVFLE